MPDEIIDNIMGKGVFTGKPEEEFVLRAKSGGKVLITEADVRRALASGGVLKFTGEPIITPFAADLIKGTGVKLVRVDQETQGQVQKSAPPDYVKTIVIGADHRGYPLKEELKKFLLKEGYKVVDVGCDKPERCDYPDFAVRVARMVANGDAERGIMIDSLGIASSIVVNKIKGVRGALCSEVSYARASREHNDANVLVLGGDVVAVQLAKDITTVWLKTPFLGGHYLERLKKVKRIEEEG